MSGGNLRSGHFRSCVAVAAALVFAGAGCSSDSPTEPLPACTGPVELSASSGTRPTLRWTPGCGAGRLLVDALPPSRGTPEWRWTVIAGERPILPGLRYGVRPEGTTTEGSGSPLERGRPYPVILFSLSGAVIARAEFTP